ncbi:CvpA family protein [Schlesneria sp. T3-172]|uniref:CvpA family protein n=1 Tax=Schlesneria sphaerica TaxID=3373610 RepID=UPI0037CC73BD
MTGLGGVTVYDGVMALIVLFTTVHGFWKGATWQIAPIMSLVLGYMVAMPMSVTMAHYFGDPPQNRLFALVTIYIAVSMVVYLLVRSFREGIERAKLTELDRHLGALLGALKGVLLTLSITVILIIYSTVARDLILKSESSTIAAKIINAVYPILPKAMHQILRPYLRQLDNELPLDLNVDDDGQLNNTLLPERRMSLTPTSSATGTSTGSGRSSFDDFLPDSRTRDEGDDDDDLYGLPPARTPRRSIVPVEEYDSRSIREAATRTDRRPASQYDYDFVEPPPRGQRPLVPTPADADDDDPFLPKRR